jgi:HK97 family phage prohead protease
MTRTALAQRSNDRPPRDGLVRLWAPGVEVREDTGSGSATPTLVGHFAVFNRWTEIDSFFEGTFMERIAPGAFKKTMREQRSSVRVLFQHGRDPQIGDKPIGSIEKLEEDGEGAAYEVPLFRGIPDLIMDGLRSDQYGASFKFRVMREDIVVEPAASKENPKGLDERTIKECQLFEFGPVTFPAYAEATAGLRSLTDDYILDGMAHADPELVRMAGQGVDLAGLIAHRFGVSIPRGIAETDNGRDDNADDRVQRAIEDEAEVVVGTDAETQIDATTLGVEDEPVERDDNEHEDEDRDGASGAADDGQVTEAPDINENIAAPESGSSTPLIGPAGFRESWRL